MYHTFITDVWSWLLLLFLATAVITCNAYNRGRIALVISVFVVIGVYAVFMKSCTLTKFFSQCFSFVHDVIFLIRTHQTKHLMKLHIVYSCIHFAKALCFSMILHVLTYIFWLRSGNVSFSLKVVMVMMHAVIYCFIACFSSFIIYVSRLDCAEIYYFLVSFKVFIIL